MPFPVGAAILAGGSLLGGLLGGRSKKSTNQFTQTQSLDPSFQGFGEMLMRQLSQQIQNPSGLPGGFAEAGVRDINRTWDTVGTGMEGKLAARGLSGSPVAATTLAQTETGRAGSIADFLAGLPLKERALQQEDMRQGLGLFGMAPRTVSGTGSATTPGNALGQGFTDAASLLAYLYGQGKIGG